MLRYVRLAAEHWARVRACVRAVPAYLTLSDAWMLLREPTNQIPSQIRMVFGLHSGLAAAAILGHTILGKVAMIVLFRVRESCVNPKLCQSECSPVL